MKLNTKQSGGYTIIMATLMIGFLLIFVGGILNLVIKELKDNRGDSNYLKAYSAAEGAQELALLKIKENGYGYYEEVKNKASEENSIILAEDFKQESNYKKSKDLLISYDLGSKTNSYSGTLAPAGDEVFPLFLIKDKLGNLEIIKDLKLEVTSGDELNLGWTLTSSTGDGIGGNKAFDENTIGRGRKSNANYLETTVGDFLTNHTNGVYLLIYSIDSSQEIKYELTSTRDFTKPKTYIISSAQIGNYKQNLKTKLDNSEFLNILKYSIYSK